MTHLPRAAGRIGIGLALIAGGAASCGGGEPVPFVAFERDFQAFETWEAFDVGHIGQIGDMHGEGPRRVYLKERPPGGSKAFPIGTIIVKELVLEANATARNVFAMVKRAGRFNPAGNGWEWFGLRRREDGSMRLVWRGIGPPSDGDAYGDPNGCNPCHKADNSNDMVKSPELGLRDLSNAPGP